MRAIRLSDLRITTELPQEAQRVIHQPLRELKSNQIIEALVIGRDYFKEALERGLMVDGVEFRGSMRVKGGALNLPARQGICDPSGCYFLGLYGLYRLVIEGETILSLLRDIGYWELQWIGMECYWVPRDSYVKGTLIRANLPYQLPKGVWGYDISASQRAMEALDKILENHLESQGEKT